MPVIGVVLALSGACKFARPADVADDDVSGTYQVGGMVRGLWSGGAITIHVDAPGVSEDLAVDATAPFAFESRLLPGDAFVVTVKDDGPDHDCVVANGSGTIDAADVIDLSVECTNLIAHAVAINTPSTFSFDPTVTRYTLPVSVLQQRVSVLVTGPALTSVAVGGQASTVGQLSPPVALTGVETVVPVVVTKAPWSRRYELVFERGGAATEEALYARATNGGPDGFGASVAMDGDASVIAAPW